MYFYIGRYQHALFSKKYISVLLVIYDIQQSITSTNAITSSTFVFAYFLQLLTDTFYSRIFVESYESAVF